MVKGSVNEECESEIVLGCVIENEEYESEIALGYESAIFEDFENEIFEDFEIESAVEKVSGT